MRLATLILSRPRRVGGHEEGVVVNTRSRVRVTTGLAVLGMVGPVGLMMAGSASAAVVPATAATAATAARAGCGLGSWGERVEGTPKGFAAGAKGGDFLWHTAAGFRLRVTHNGDHREVYTGEITADAPLAVSRARLEAGDVVRLSADRKAIVFAFVDDGHVDGLDFTTDCATRVEVSHLNVGDTALPASRVYLGGHRVHPSRVPFTIARPVLTHTP